MQRMFCDVYICGNHAQTDYDVAAQTFGQRLLGLNADGKLYVPPNRKMTPLLSLNQMIQSLDQIILGHATTAPEASAVLFNESSWTYQELHRRTLLCAEALEASGVKKGDFVAVLLPPTAEVIPTALAIWSLGAIYAPLDPDYPDDQLQVRLKELDDRVAVACLEKDAARFAEWGRTQIVLDALPHDRSAGVSDSVPCSPDDPACVFFTSGSTGAPKGVMGSVRAVKESICDPAAALEFGPQDTLNSIARYSWSISMLELFAALSVGGTTLVLDRGQALNLSWLAQNASRCTAFHCPPALLSELVDFTEREETPSFEGIRLVWYGGDAIAPAVLEGAQRVFSKARIATAYGCTEIFGLSHFHAYPRGQAIEQVLIGKPVQSIIQRLEAAPGQPGIFELLLGGGRIATEYRGRPELNAEKFVELDEERFFRTGDFVRQISTGSLQFGQRLDDQVKIRGIRVELGEVEAQLARYEGTKKAVVLAAEVKEGVKELIAFLVAQPGLEDAVAGARAWMVQVMPDYLVPSRFVVLDEFPVTENFKVDRKKLLEIADETMAAVGSFDGDLSRIAAVWLSAGARPASETDNFFDVGGDSLSAARVAAELTHEFDRTVTVADVYSAPTLQGLAERIERRAFTRADVSEDSFHAAEGQRGLFFRELLENKPGTITCTRYILHKEGFDDAVLRQAMGALVNRYPTLRTRLVLARNNLSQELLEVNEALLASALIQRVEGIFTLQEGSPTSRVKKQTMRFDLNKPPLIGAAISALEEGGELLQLAAHHTASDDNSMGRLSADFVELYDSMCGGPPPELAEPENDYREFCADQSSRIVSGAYIEQAEQVAQDLLSHLAEHPEPLLGATPKGKVAGNMETISLDGLEPPRFAEVVAAMTWAMAQEFGQSQFVLCAHVALRRNDLTSPRVGMYVNLVPVFASADLETDFKQHARVTARTVRQAMSRSDVPFEVVMRSSPELRKLGGYPFDAFVNELRFDNEYRAGYDDVHIGRSFATDAGKLNLSYIRSGDGNELMLEAPVKEAAPKSDSELLVRLGQNSTASLNSLR